MNRNTVVCGCCMLGALGVDQLSKYAAASTTINPGISFGLLASGWLATSLAIVVLGLAVRYGARMMAVSPTATGIFFGASLSNLIDRLLFGGVRDYLHLPILNIQNNLADWGITLSLIWLFFLMSKSSPGK